MKLLWQYCQINKHHIVCTLGVLVNLEGASLSAAKGDLVVPIVTWLAEVLSQDVTAMLVAKNGITNGAMEAETPEAQAESNKKKMVLLYNNRQSY